MKSWSSADKPERSAAAEVTGGIEKKRSNSLSKEFPAARTTSTGVDVASPEVEVTAAVAAAVAFADAVETTVGGILEMVPITSGPGTTVELRLPLPFPFPYKAGDGGSGSAISAAATAGGISGR